MSDGAEEASEAHVSFGMLEKKKSGKGVSYIRTMMREELRHPRCIFYTDMQETAKARLCELAPAAANYP